MLKASEYHKIHFELNSNSVNSMTLTRVHFEQHFKVIDNRNSG